LLKDKCYKIYTIHIYHTNAHTHNTHTHTHTHTHTQHTYIHIHTGPDKCLSVHNLSTSFTRGVARILTPRKHVVIYAWSTWWKFQLL